MAALPPTSNPDQAQALIQALLNGPAAEPPAGVEPNFKNPQNINAVIIPLLSLFSIILTLAVIVRTYTKLYIIRSIAYEDYVILLAWIGTMGFLYPSIMDFKVGGGTHMWDIRLRDYFQILHWLNISGILYGIIVFLIKLSILLQYLRILVPNRKASMSLYVAIQVLIWSNFLFYFVDTIIEIIMCTPREKIWNPLMTTGHCFNANAAYMATGVFNVISDFSILILPMVPIWKLQMPLRRKLMIMTIFAAGVCACVTSTLRTYYTWKIIHSPDSSYNTIVMGLWTWGEITAGIVVSCLPVTPKFFQHLWPRVYRLLSYPYASSSKLGDKTGSPGTNTGGLSGRVKPTLRPSAADSDALSTCKNTYEHQVPHYGEYFTLGEVDTATLKGSETDERALLPTSGHPTRREDLEIGSIDPRA